MDDEESNMASSLSESLRVSKKLGISSAITSLTLVPGGPFLFSQFEDDLKRISLNSLKQFRNLKSLKMTDICFEDFPVLRKAFRSFRGLKNLEIAFARTTFISDRNCPLNFIKIFSPRLNQLKLAFNDSYFGYQPQDYRSHLRNCRVDRLNNLQKLVLDFPAPLFLQEKKISEENSSYIDLSPMKRLNRLQSLDIVVENWSGYEDVQTDTNELYFDPNKLFPNLKKFTWKVCDNKELEIIGIQIASQLKYLDDFGVGFGLRKAKVEIQELSQNLATLQTDLNRLDFAYNCGELLKQDAKALIYELSSERLNKLHTLSLEFNCCKGITNGFLTDLAQVCAKNFAGLRSLRLSFEGFEPDGPRIPSFIKAVFGIEGISDRGINNWGEILSKNCLQLEFVSLEFKRYLQISDKGVKGLCGRLNSLERLETVRIRFKDCWNVTKKGCEEATKLLGTHRHVLISGWNKWNRSQICCRRRY